MATKLDFLQSSRPKWFQNFAIRYQIVLACCLSSITTLLLSYVVYLRMLPLHQYNHQKLPQVFPIPAPPLVLPEIPNCRCTNENGSTSSISPRESTNSHPVKSNLVIHELENIQNVVIRYADQEAFSDRCPLVTGRRIAINYAGNCCRYSQKLNCETALNVGGFDVCISFTEKSLDEDFAKRNAHILADNPGAGLWLWKPYIVLKTLLAMRDDDVLFYVDSGAHFVDNMDSGPICLQAERGDDITLFTYECAEQKYSKADAYLLMGCFDDYCFNGTQLTAGFILLRKTFRSILFVSQWLAYAQDHRIISNQPSQLVKENPKFFSHRNDQSIVSLLSKKWKLADSIFPDPSQWGGANDFGRNLRNQPRFKLVSKTFIQNNGNKL